MKIKRCFIMIAVLSLVLLAACKSKTATNDLTGQSNSPYLVSKNPLELTLHLHFFNTKSYNAEWSVFKKAQEYTNVSLKSKTSASASDSLQVYNILIASGELPDIVGYVDPTKFMSDALAGAFIPMEGLIEKNAPHIKAYLEKYPEAKKAITAPDGHIYGIANFNDQENKTGMGWFIRKDWLDKLGLQMPDTVDEYYNALKAFRDKDMNGNGKADEMPFFSRGKSPNFLLQLWNATDTFLVEDNKVKYGPVESTYKTAMENIAKWYAEKIIDNEIFSRDNTVREIVLGQNQGGSTFDWIASTSVFNENLKDTINGFQFAVMAPPTTANGKKYISFIRSVTSTTGWAISQSNKHPDETMKYFDFWFTPEGERLQNYGIEGTDYTMVDGKPKFTDAILHGGKPVIDALQAEGAVCQGIGYPMTFDYEYQSMDPIGKTGADLYKQKNYINDSALPTLNLKEDEQKEYNKIMSNITTYVTETSMQWIMGAADVDSGFNTFVDNLKNMGIEKAISIQQAAYDRYNAQ